MQSARLRWRPSTVAFQIDVFHAYHGGATGENRGRTVDVGSFAANAFGLYDMHGNVLEWTCSAYDEKYAGGETQCAKGGDENRVVRGGSWDSDPARLRSALRDDIEPRARFNFLGFRLARAVH